MTSNKMSADKEPPDVTSYVYHYIYVSTSDLWIGNLLYVSIDTSYHYVSKYHLMYLYNDLLSIRYIN